MGRCPSTSDRNLEGSSPLSSSTPQKNDRVLIAVSGTVLFLISLAALIGEATPSWAGWQAEVKEEVARRLGADKAADVETGIQQIWISELLRVDRCVTCHVTIEWGDEMADAPHPARSHPLPDLMRAHPPETFGCTLCHGGQGIATTEAAAHGDLPHWEEPLLDSKRAALYGITRTELMELRCNTCHQREEQVEGMPFLNEAKRLAIKHKCTDCHVILGQGRTKAPDLMREGEKHATKYVFPEDWSKPHTAVQWHIEHFLDPNSTSPGSSMDRFGFTRRQATAMALLVLSWKKPMLPPAWTPGAMARVR